MMIGSEPPALVRSRAAFGDEVLRVAELEVPKLHEFGVALRAVSFSLREGEILGLAGISGNGQAELLALLAGEETTLGSGRIELGGRDIRPLGPEPRRALGLRYVPVERLGRATLASLSLTENLLLTRRDVGERYGFVRAPALKALCSKLMQRFSVKSIGPNARAASLSGGNLQKFVVGREIEARPKLLIVAEPTWGVDVGASVRIRRELIDLSRSGAAVLVVSEDLDELFELCDTLRVMANGMLSPPLAASVAERARIGEWMSGRWERSDGSADSSERTFGDRAHAAH
jgi:simple sugar transport system ATP-binding protein